MLRPGIEKAFARDLELFRWLAGLAERAHPEARRLRARASVDTLAETVALEMDLRLEAAAASELAERQGDIADRYRTPAIDWQRTARRVLTTEWITGIPIDDREALDAAGHDLEVLAQRLLRAFLRQAFAEGYFHADPHPGNLFVEPDGTIAAVDFGIMGRLDRESRRFVAELLFAFLNGDYRRAAEVHFEAGYVPPEQSVEAFAQACRSIGEPIQGLPASEISMGRLLEQLFEITATFRMPTQPQLLLLQKTMVIAEGVARALAPEVNMWTAAGPVLEQVLADALGPEARFRAAAEETAAMARRVPQLIAKAEAASGMIADGALKLHPETARELAAAHARERRPLYMLLWAVVVLLAVLVLTSI